MAKVRILSRKGMDLFGDYIEEVRRGSNEAPPVQKLEQSPWSLEFSQEVEVGDLSATTRLELGQYLVMLFESHNVDRKLLVDNPGLWSWLALLWFDKLCPPDGEGNRKVKETARYVCSRDYTDYYRHLVAAPWDIFSIHGEYSRVMLLTLLYRHSDIAEQFAAPQEIISNKELIKVLDKLYWDPVKKKPKDGIQSRQKAGNHRRLKSWIQQIARTYDLRSMSAEEIRSLLPSEFDVWKM